MAAKRIICFLTSYYPIHIFKIFSMCLLMTSSKAYYISLTRDRLLKHFITGLINGNHYSKNIIPKDYQANAREVYMENLISSELCSLRLPYHLKVSKAGL